MGFRENPSLMFCVAIRVWMLYLTCFGLELMEILTLSYFVHLNKMRLIIKALLAEFFSFSSSSPDASLVSQAKSVAVILQYWSNSRSCPATSIGYSEWAIVTYSLYST